MVNIHFQYCFDFDNRETPIYFAFCFPYSYESLQADLDKYKSTASNMGNSVYYHQEVLTKTTDGRNIDLLTISSNLGMDSKAEERRIDGLFPVTDNKRCNT